MSPPNVLLISLIVFVLLIEVIVVLVLWLYFRLSAKHDELQKTMGSQTPVSNSQSGEIIDKAEAQAAELLRTATAKSEEIIRQSQFLTDQLSDKLTKDLERLPQIQEQVYRQVFERVGQESQKMLTQIAKEMEQQALAETKTFGAVLQKEAVASQESVKQLIADAYSRAEQEIQDYKKHRMERVDASIQELVARVSREVMGKVLTGQDHAELVKQILERNKGDLMIN